MTRYLPDELIIRIIDYSDSIAHVATCRLVCKLWNRLAEPLMFGKEITIASEEGALLLYGYLCRNPHCGKLVKRISFQEGGISCAIQEALLHHVFTPNMEEMRGVMYFEEDFFDTMRRIANTSTAKFDKLRVIPHPPYYSDVYDDTLIAFKDTLREMVLVFDSNLTQTGRGILSSMMDFKSLVHLTLKGNLVSLFLMEDILQHCPMLKALTINLQLADNIHEKTFVENWARPIVNTINSVKKVIFLHACRSDQLEYIRLKCPEMDTLIINVDSTPLANSNSNIKRIVEATAKVPTYNIKLLIKKEHLKETLKYVIAEKCQLNVKEADFERFRIEMQSSAP